MKISIKRYTVAAAVLLFMGSCSKDFLNRTNPNLPVEATYWTTEADAVAAIPTIYSPIRNQMYGYYGAFTGYQTMNRADDMWFLVGEEPHTWQLINFINTPGTGGSDFGSLYNGINRANVFMKNIDRVTMDSEKKKQLIGEVRFLRGMYYFLLAANYGDVPLRLTPATDEPNGENIASSPEAEIWKQVISDFKAAKDGLPVSRPSSESGRVTKGAAIAYLGKTLVYNKQYGEAETELKALLTAPYNYDLVDNFEDNYKETTKFNKESVWELAYDGRLSAGGVWGDDCASCQLGFVLPNFAGPGASGAWFKLVPGISVVRDFISEERPAGSDTRFDKRMYGSFYWKYSDYETGLTDGAWYGNLSFDDLWKESLSKISVNAGLVYPTINGKAGRFLLKKYTNFYINKSGSNSMYDAANRNNNLRVFRFAEVLLLHAEACVKNGNLAGAASSLKRIRDRAGLANKTWANADALMKEVVKQNELEFFFEGHRFFDLKRWYTPTEMKQIFVDNKKQGADNFQPKHYYLPIPEGEINTNSKIQQHPLWR
ncbi:RagB/SusD family nutrient uptake outer membrane protein [Sphingobacterium sp. Lzh-3]|uniref:RagB/SusD family nutrient uptake outer membrane protein n=1 Tax=unclassified Sphingobacterium TaxID=2609468 RepID=UPI002819D562|nr:RagB/SusD family nutrient uptake outer membrane protein [Sphingobacterium sp. UGAL515B_05]MDR2275285.1 RagB/SusD family nutrient uptake outer membrane protein [Sphingobacterium sp.]WON96738.1 RagB/SusD family nutrient uptake outer membrane protein [Sphingobacterium sp. UGAL515B_05]